MRREILYLKRYAHISGDAPMVDSYPDDSYNGRKSKKARRKGKKLEHRYVRRKYRNLIC